MEGGSVRRRPRPLRDGERVVTGESLGPSMQPCSFSARRSGPARPTLGGGDERQSVSAPDAADRDGPLEWPEDTAGPVSCMPANAAFCSRLMAGFSHPLRGGETRNICSRGVAGNPGGSAIDKKKRQGTSVEGTPPIQSWPRERGEHALWPSWRATFRETRASTTRNWRGADSPADQIKSLSAPSLRTEKYRSNGAVSPRVRQSFESFSATGHIGPDCRLPYPPPLCSESDHVEKCTSPKSPSRTRRVVGFQERQGRTSLPPLLSPSCPRYPPLCPPFLRQPNADPRCHICGFLREIIRPHRSCHTAN